MKKKTKKITCNLPYFVKDREYLQDIYMVDSDCNLDFYVRDLTAFKFFLTFMNNESRAFMKHIFEITPNIDMFGDCNIMEYPICRDPVTVEPLWDEMGDSRCVDLGLVYNYLNDRELNEDFGNLSIPLISEEIYFRQIQIMLKLRNDYWGSLDEYK